MREGYTGGQYTVYISQEEWQSSHIHLQSAAGQYLWRKKKIEGRRDKDKLRTERNEEKNKRREKKENK